MSGNIGSTDNPKNCWIYRRYLGGCVLFLAGMTACGTPRNEPTQVAKAYALASLRGDAVEMIRWLEPSVQQRLENVAQRASDQVGRRRLIARDEMLQIAGLDPAFVYSGVREIQNDGVMATVEVKSTSGAFERLELVQTDEGWRVLANVPAGFGAQLGVD